MSTVRTPRVISCAEDLPQHIAVPRGSALDVTEIPRAHGVTIDIDDQRTIGTEVAATFDGALTSIQQHAADALLANEIGVFVAPPGVAKTVIGTTSAPHVVAARRSSCTEGR